MAWETAESNWPCCASPQGWKFNQEEEGCTEDTAAGGIKFIRDLYEREGSAEKSVRCSEHRGSSVSVQKHSCVNNSHSLECTAQTVLYDDAGAGVVG